MGKRIAVADEFYRKLKREKSEQSFSEVIQERLDDGGSIADVTGTRILEAETDEEVKDDFERISRGTVTRVVDETA